MRTEEACARARLLQPCGGGAAIKALRWRWRSLIPRHEHAACFNSHKLTGAFAVREKASCSLVCSENEGGKVRSSQAMSMTEIIFSLPPNFALNRL